MSGSMPRLVVFDLVGTTMQDDGAVAELFLQVLASAGLDATPEGVARVRGASKREAFLRLTEDPERADQLLQHFLSGLRQHYASAPPREVPGACATFGWLRAQGVKLALNTGFEKKMVALLVESLGWGNGLFDAIVCGDEVEAGRPSPAMIQEAMRRTGIQDGSSVMTVGDTVLDLQAGTAAQAGWVVGVTSGAHDHDTLLQAPHTHLIANIANIRELLR
jgi:phosphoglycolate phosphatase